MHVQNDQLPGHQSVKSAHPTAVFSWNKRRAEDKLKTDADGWRQNLKTLYKNTLKFAFPKCSVRLQIGQKSFTTRFLCFSLVLINCFSSCYKQCLGSTYWPCLSVLCPSIKPLVSLKINHTVASRSVCSPCCVPREKHGLLNQSLLSRYQHSVQYITTQALKLFVLHLKVPHIHALLSGLPISPLLWGGGVMTAAWRFSILCYSYFHDKEEILKSHNDPKENTVWLHVFCVHMNVRMTGARAGSCWWGFSPSFTLSLLFSVVLCCSVLLWRKRCIFVCFISCMYLRCKIFKYTFCSGHCYYCL